MTLSGPDALRSLEDALRDIRSEEDDIAKRLSRSNEIVAKLQTAEADLLRQLAAVRLDPETQTELSGRLSQAELTARERQQAHADELAATQARLTSLDGSIAELNGKRTENLKAIAGYEAELKGLRDKVLPGLEQDAGFAARKQGAASLAEIAAEASRKTQQAEQDREVKGRPYRDDTLFMYLWARGYGTGGYKANNLVRYLDAWVARLVRFEDARPNYAMLIEIPLRLREHAERQQQSAAAAQEEVRALEEAAVDKAGGKPVRDRLQETQAAVDAAAARIVELEDQRDSAVEEQRQLTLGDAALAEALTVFAQALGREDVGALASQARSTQTGQDDALVQQIEAARQRIADENKQVGEHEDRLKILAKRRRELEDIQYEFKKARFDDPRSRFGEDRLTGDLLTEFLRGGMSAAGYWDTWRRTQSWVGGGPAGPWGAPQGPVLTPMPDEGKRPDARNPPWPEAGGGFHWPDSSFAGGSGRRSGGGFGGWVRTGGGTGGGGGFSRPRGGGVGGGGFKTGGGFGGGGRGFKTGGGF